MAIRSRSPLVDPVIDLDYSIFEKRYGAITARHIAVVYGTERVGVFNATGDVSMAKTISQELVRRWPLDFRVVSAGLVVRIADDIHKLRQTNRNKHGLLFIRSYVPGHLETYTNDLDDLDERMWDDFEKGD